MKSAIIIRNLLLGCTVVAFMSCKKQVNDVQTTPKDETLSETAKIVVPSEMASSGSTARTDDDYNTFYGPVFQMGNGHIRSWINIRRSDDKPLAIGLEMTDNSLSGLSTNPTDFEGNTFMLPLHQKAKAVTPFDHIMVNWNPNGHEPPHIYDLPHFDIHFYKIPVAEQMMITGAPTAAPPAGYLPASYVIQGGIVPQMGTHWLDPASPELPPTLATFTHTLIYGSNNGAVIFIEPMITRAYFLSGSSITKAYPQPVHFSPGSTNYPTVYKIWKDAGNSRHYTALTDFVAR
jgi:hypothetical protein